MMKQYREARESLEDDTLLLFRLGDFYEMFETDAERGAALLGITLTKRHDMPMAGIPFHAAEGYLTKLLNHGHKVAICDQLETAQTGKLVKRGITRILTPGTVLEDRQLDASANHFLLAVTVEKNNYQPRGWISRPVSLNWDPLLILMIFYRLSVESVPRKSCFLKAGIKKFQLLK